MAKVYISPSTQEHNQGVIPGYIEETEMNLIADLVVPLAQFNHLEVYRNKPSMTLAQVVADSNNRGVDAHFAIHSNSGGARGCEVFCYPNSKNGKKLASLVYRHMEGLTPVTDRGVKENAHLYELNSTKAPSALVEVDFHDSVEGAKWIETHRPAIAEAIVRGICDYFGYEFKKPTTVAPPSTNGNRMLLAKKVQTFLNASGMTDSKGSILATDGIAGACTKQALDKLTKSLGY